MAGKTQIPAELAGQMTPEVRAFVESLLLRIESLEQQLAEAGKTPDSSSVPPSTQHPHAKPPK